MKGILPFLPANDAGVDAKIEENKIMQYYFLQPYFGIDDADVENDATYTGNRRILVAYLVAYDLLYNKVLGNVGGSSAEGTDGSEAGQRIKKGKADVVEAEFDYAKAGDGNSLVMGSEGLLSKLLEKICSLSATLKIQLPMCDCDDEKTAIFPAFKSYCG